MIDKVLADCGLVDLPEDALLDTIGDRLRRLGKAVEVLPDTERQLVREGALRELKHLDISSPAKLVDSYLGSSAHEVPPDETLAFPPTEPWPNEVAGDELLDAISSFMLAYISMTRAEAHASALWVVHTHTVDAAEHTPILDISSPVKGCGKTTFLSILYRLVYRPQMISNTSSAGIFRTVDKYTPTLLIDEADSFMNGGDMRGILNSGHTKLGAVIRCGGDDFEPQSFSTWCPKAIAGIGSRAETLQDRSILIKLKKASMEDRPERLNMHKVGATMDELRAKAVAWSADAIEKLREAEPTMPPLPDPRSEDNWRPLLAIADLAGGRWPDLARSTARRLAVRDQQEMGPDVGLLDDIRRVLESLGRAKIPSALLVRELVAMEDRPWQTIENGGKGLAPHSLARRLKPFRIRPKTIREGSGTIKGYHARQFTDAFQRYLPLRDTPKPVTSSQPNSAAHDPLPTKRNVPETVTTTSTADTGHDDLKVTGVTVQVDDIAYPSEPLHKVGGQKAALPAD